MRAAILSGLLCSAAFAQAADPAWNRMIESKRQVTAYLERMAREITRRAAAEIASRESWERVRAQRIEEMRDMLGLLPWPERAPLNARVTGTLDKGAYLIEKLAFESLPKVYVTANLYLPKERAGRVPAIVYVCGHSYSPHGAKAKYQRHGISLAKNGYAALIVDPIQLAETFALHHGVQSQEMWEWYARGYSPAGVEVWNAMRAIDYLETRPEVDSGRIGMTGRSGGAAMTWFTAAVDARVKAAMPVMGISTYAANVALNTQRLHCDCMFPINSLLHDMLHQGALIAPRPLWMAHGRKDALFPVPGYEEFERTIGALFESYGRRAVFDNLVVETGHEDSDFLREQSVRFFDRHLLRTARKPEMDYSNAPEAELAVFPAGPPADALNYRIHELFLPTPEFRAYPDRAAWEARAAGLRSLLRSKVFKAFPADAAAPPLDIARAARADGAAFDRLEFTSEMGVRIRGLIRGAAPAAAKVPALLWVASDGDTERSLGTLIRVSRPPDRFVRAVVFPRGVDETGWDKSFYKDTMRNAMHVGHTIDSMRLWDVLRALQALRAQPGVDPDRILAGGQGVSGVLALYAALLDPGVHQVVLQNPPSSHLDGPYFLNILRYTDLPEAAALLAPRRLNFLGRMPAAFESARRVYSLYGLPGHIHVSMELDALLEGRYHHNFGSGI